MVARIPIPMDAVAGFCRRWRIRELSLFGSVLRDDFSPRSDVDVLAVFEEQAPWSAWDWPAMEAELREIFGRQVHLVEKAGLRNPFLREAILREREVVYAR